MAGVLAVLTLHAGAALEEVAAERTAHDVVELSLHELVSVHLVHFLLALPYGALPTKAEIHGAAILVLLDEVQAHLDLARRLQVEPARDGILRYLGLRRWLHLPVDGPVLLELAGRRRRRAKLGLGVHGELRRRRSGVAHPIGRNPARRIDLGFDPLPTQLLGDV